MARRDSYGYERAIQHIEEARRLRAELGDAEAQTRRTFLNLDSRRLHDLLEAYRQEYGQSPYEYCLHALPAWRSGRRKMSGMVAERIFNLLPRFVTSDERQQIAEKLWRHLSPSSNMSLRVNTASRPEEVRKALDDYARRFIKDYEFPDTLRARFTWIANNDVQLAQELLNYFQRREYGAASRAVRMRVPLIIEKMNRLSGGLRGTATEEIRVGKHRLTIIISGSARDGVRLEERTTTTTTTGDEWGCFWLFLVGGGLLWLLNSGC